MQDSKKNSAPKPLQTKKRQNQRAKKNRKKNEV